MCELTLCLMACYIVGGHQRSDQLGSLIATVDENSLLCAGHFDFHFHAEFDDQ